MRLTHYDVLQVSRNASPEVIAAAYRSLSKVYHPDRRPGDATAAHLMTQINASYRILADPIARARYDEWLDRTEDDNSRATPTDSAPVQEPNTGTARKARRVSRYKIALALVPLILLIWALAVASAWRSRSASPNASTPAPTEEMLLNRLREAANEASTSIWSRPATTPYGHSWPAAAGYLSGAARRHTTGLSTVTIDNSQNDADVHVKLASLSGPEAYPVREFFIPAFSKFTVRNVDAGSYDVRYRELKTGSLSRSEKFLLEEIKRSDRTEYTALTLTLYLVTHGNLQMYPLAESEF